MPLAVWVEDYAEAGRLVTGEEPEVLEFLNRQPLRNVILIGAIEEHGLESPHHRGAFYACRNEAGGLDSVALVGHWVLLTEGLKTARIFARLARRFHAGEVEVVLGEEFTVEAFDSTFTGQPTARTIRSSQPQNLFAIRELDWEAQGEVGDLRLAEMGELEEVVEAHARACFEIHGYDKRTLDPAGFGRRVSARVEAGRVWIARDRKGVAFKCDVVLATEQAFYLEGIWTRPDARGRGFGTDAMKGLCSKLLRQRAAVCLFADAEDQQVTSFYRRVGFRSMARSRLTRYGEIT